MQHLLRGSIRPSDSRALRLLTTDSLAYTANFADPIGRVGMRQKVRAQSKSLRGKRKVGLLTFRLPHA